MSQSKSNATGTVTESKRPSLLHPGEKVYACPECDKAPVYVRVRDNRTIGELPFACYQCGTDFEMPVCREKIENTGGGSELTRKLEATDAEDVLT